MPKLGGWLLSFAQALRIGVRDDQLTISLFRGSHTMRKVCVSIVIPLLTLSALAGLQGWSYTAGEGVAASTLRLSSTTGQEALNIVSVAGQSLISGTMGPRRQQFLILHEC